MGEQTEQLKAHQLFDCIECGACAYVCPSSIPLVQYYRAAKAGIREQEQLQQKADYSKNRFELRLERLRLAEEQKEAERQARAERNAKARASQAESSPIAPADEQLKRLKIEASMAQIALKKAEKQLAQHDTEELKAQVAQLRNAAEAAQHALLQAHPSAPAGEQATAPGNSADDQLKKAKIEAAMLKAQLRKLEKVEDPSQQQQDELIKLRSQLSNAEQAVDAASTQSPAAARPEIDAALKKAKIEAAMLKAQLRKLEKVEKPNQEQQEQLTQLRSQLNSAEQAVDAASAQSPAAAKPEIDAALKKAKIEAAMLKAQLRKLEKVENPSQEQQEQLTQLRSQLDGAEQAVDAASVPAPTVARPVVDAALKKAKIELAVKRTELKKAEKAELADNELQALREAVRAAENALHAAEAASPKAPPEHVLVNKSGLNEQQRALKTEVAFARADLRKLERDESSATEALDSARARLTEAERLLAEYQDNPSE
jgi:electron transport complex protein RnfC